MKKRDRYQTVILELSDGRKVSFTGKATVLPERDRDVKVISIAFTEPKSLPAGCTLELIEKSSVSGSRC